MRSRELFVLRSLVAVATSPAMPRWPEYRARVEAERGRGPVPRIPSAAALIDVVAGPGRHDAWVLPPTADVVGALVSFLDDHGATFPRACFPAREAQSLFDTLARRAPHTVAPAELFALALRRTRDPFRALLACHLATRQLARGRDTRAFSGTPLTLEQRCDVGLAIAPFPPELARGGDPLGDTYHYFANVLAGVHAAHDPVHGASVRRLFHAGPLLMHWVRERTFRRPLFFGNHAAVDRCGLAHGLALGEFARAAARYSRLKNASTSRAVVSGSSSMGT